MLGVSFSFPWEISLMVFLQAHFNKFGVLLSQFFSLLGQEYPLVLFVCIFYFAIDKNLGKRILFSLLAVLTWCPMLKNVALRRRPYFDHEEIKILLPAVPTEDAYDMVAQGFSFPSAHASCSAAAYPQITHYAKRKWVRALGYIIPFCIGLSRFCVGAHYPTDVFVGWILGLLVAFLVPFAASKIKNENYIYIAILITALPGIFFCETTDYFSGLGLLIGAVFGVIFEERKVGFEKPKNIKWAIIRVVCGIAFFLLFAQGIKFILGEGIVVRVIRYAVGAFMALGVYPLAFRKFEKESSK